MGKFAEGTTVSAEKSRAEIETVLKKHGITDVAIMNMRGQATVLFQKGFTGYRITMPAVDATSREFTHRGHSRLSATDAARKVAQEERRRWRALFLVLKAKLVAATDGVVTFEQEFLAFALAKDGRTIGEHVIPQLEGGSLDVTQLALPGANHG